MYLTGYKLEDIEKWPTTAMKNVSETLALAAQNYRKTVLSTQPLITSLFPTLRTSNQQRRKGRRKKRPHTCHKKTTLHSQPTITSLFPANRASERRKKKVGDKQKTHIRSHAL